MFIFSFTNLHKQETQLPLTTPHDASAGVTQFA